MAVTEDGFTIERIPLTVEGVFIDDGFFAVANNLLEELGWLP